MIKELMLITTILYGNALPTFDNADKQPIKQLMTNSPNINVSMGVIYLDITNNDTSEYYEYVPLTYTLKNIRANTDVEEYTMAYYFQCIYTAGSNQNTSTITKTQYLNYNEYQDLINNLLRVELIVDIANLTTTTLDNGDTRLLTQLIVDYAISSSSQTYEVSQTYDLVIPLAINGTTITNFTINNTYRTYYTGFAIRSAFGDIVNLYYDKGYDNGYNSGLADGYDNGYNAGTLNFDFVSWIPNAIGGFLNFEIFPNFTLSNVLLAIVGAFLAIWILRVFVGG